LLLCIIFRWVVAGDTVAIVGARATGSDATAIGGGAGMVALVGAVVRNSDAMGDGADPLMTPVSKMNPNGCAAAAPPPPPALS
jgi:hypothetical protein